MNDLKNLEIASLVMKILIPLAIFFIIIKVDWAKRAISLNDRAHKNIEGKLKTSNKKYFSYDRIDTMLHAKGIYYMLNGEINPVTFMVLKVAIALIFGMVGFSIIGWIGTIIAGVLGFFILDILINLSNESDNEDMLMDIKRIFDTLKIQTKGSVHLSNALLECYMVVSNKRLKKELQKLSSYILATNDVPTAVKNFNAQFQNQYIDSLCMTLLQAQDNGKSVQLLDDLSKQIANMQTALNIKEKDRIERKTQFYEILIFAGLIAFCVYALATNLMTSLLTF